MFKYDSELNDGCNTSFIIYLLLSHILYMLVIVESISAGLIISLINKYLLNTKALDECMHEQEDNYESEEVSSVVAGVSDTSCVQHVHV